MAVEQNRRDFLGMAFGGVAAVGGVFALGAMKQTWDPLPSVQAAGFTTVDLSPMKPGEFRTIEWRKKPIFILKKDSNMEKNGNRDVVVDGSEYTVVIGLCTHLGCIPAWKPNEQKFHCACHGGDFDVSGVNTFGPPPRPMDIPPFKIEGSKLVLGEEGPEYDKLVGNA
ncbi:MAG: ubiquinol-cytochrome c reductase iron-sulfur subunit [Sulfurospirillaceae bacterium]|nr:ubiquinol-cytochrome c reductase iron-sulfur subunit [Sulfurospirillaceae bacterium]MCK9545904.1 ubiquinol-cytochrome c reductase iron-sulfur subunit [Sulfurospirillaceae bacterium]MDY0238213.1 ubiquinol-cytochrome c reductase iron-sulfur subunit [Campylobacterales bacterium]NLM99055.1 ubiquinol-cytochrome c reductase iron-sulfur subunit [Campylobacteraceae bacterium]